MRSAFKCIESHIKIFFRAVGSWLCEVKIQFARKCFSSNIQTRNRSYLPQTVRIRPHTSSSSDFEQSTKTCELQTTACRRSSWSVENTTVVCRSRKILCAMQSCQFSPALRMFEYQAPRNQGAVIWWSTQCWNRFDCFCKQKKKALSCRHRNFGEIVAVNFVVVMPTQAFNC